LGDGLLEALSASGTVKAHEAMAAAAGADSAGTFVRGFSRDCTLLLR
jgi:hypothetical protein